MVLGVALRLGIAPGCIYTGFQPHASPREQQLVFPTAQGHHCLQVSCTPIAP